MSYKINFVPSEFLYNNYIETCKIKSNTCVLVLLVFCLRDLSLCSYENNIITNSEKNDINSKIIIKEEINRIFIQKKNLDLISFYFPFKIKVKEKEKSFKIFYRNNVKIDSTMIECFRVFLINLGYPNLESSNLDNEDVENDSTISFNKIKDSLDQIEELIKNEYYNNMDEEKKSLKANQIKNTITSLLNHDYGYVRYDYDERNENGKIHPLKHIDIFTHKKYSMKIGIDTDYSIQDFIDLFDKTTNCSYLKKITQD